MRRSIFFVSAARLPPTAVTAVEACRFFMPTWLLPGDSRSNPISVLTGHHRLHCPVSPCLIHGKVFVLPTPSAVPVNRPARLAPLERCPAPARRLVLVSFFGVRSLVKLCVDSCPHQYSNGHTHTCGLCHTIWIFTESASVFSYITMKVHKAVTTWYLGQPREIIGGLAAVGSVGFDGNTRKHAELFLKTFR